MNVLNPIFDSSFKFLMEDEKSARVLLSRLLKRQVVKLVQRPQESIDNINVRPDTSSNGLNVYRLDYAATVVLDDGQEEDVCIELQFASVNIWVGNIATTRTYVRMARRLCTLWLSIFWDIKYQRQKSLLSTAGATP